uniref:Protein krueppel n=1 Tax=Anopheles christyi TaxID=43041 RepID=A0A182JWY6_9DIPT
MANIQKTIPNICRFCLCDDENQLQLIAEALHSSLTIEDVIQFTGVEIPPADVLDCAICFECLSCLENSTDFRYACIRNDITFHQLCAEATAYRKEEQQKALQIEKNLDVGSLKSTFEIVYYEDTISDPFDENTLVRSIESQDFIIDCLTQETAENSYSANYIELGEPISDDNNEEILHNQSDSCSVGRSRKSRKCEPDGVDSAQRNKSKRYNRPKPLCHLCGKQVKQMDLHVASHNNDAKFACPHCPIKMTHTTNLMRHVQAVHLKKIIKTCEVCGVGFRYKSVYKSHMLAKHNMGKMYECEVCSKQFNHPGNLREHRKRWHSSDSEFVCPICGMMFHLKKSLKSHEKVHSTNKPFSCKHCPKLFKSRDARTAHQLTHSGVVFSCKFCDKSYRYRTQLCTHITKTHRTNVGEKCASGSE